MTLRSLLRRTVPATVSAMVFIVAGCSTTTTTQTTPPSPPTSVAVTASSAAGGVDAVTASALQRALDDTRARSGSPGALARVVSPHGVWTGVSGRRAMGGNQPPAASDRTRIGSLTKTMTATVLLQLVQEGKVSLEDKIGRYVPGVPNADTASLRQLADMSSGIPSYTKSNAVVDAYFAHPERPWTPQQLIDAVKTMPPDFAPGRGWEYSNTNYVLLGMVIEKVLGQPMATVFADRLFTPLGMRDTVFPGESIAIADPHLSGWTDQGQPAGHNVDSTRWNPSLAFTAGGVISTVDDLQKWGAALFTGDGILNAKTQALRRDSILRSPPPNSAAAGYGIGIGERDGWWGHDGDIPGYNSVLFHDYRTDTTVIVATNSDNSFTDNGKSEAPAEAIFAALVAALPK